MSDSDSVECLFVIDRKGRKLANLVDDTVAVQPPRKRQKTPPTVDEEQSLQPPLKKPARTIATLQEQEDAKHKTNVARIVTLLGESLEGRLELEKLPQTFLERFGQCLPDSPRTHVASEPGQKRLLVQKEIHNNKSYVYKRNTVLSLSRLRDIVCESSDRCVELNHLLALYKEKHNKTIYKKKECLKLLEKRFFDLRVRSHHGEQFVTCQAAPATLLHPNPALLDLVAKSTAQAIQNEGAYLALLKDIRIPGGASLEDVSRKHPLVEDRIVKLGASHGIHHLQVRHVLRHCPKIQVHQNTRTRASTVRLYFRKGIAPDLTDCEHLLPKHAPEGTIEEPPPPLLARSTTEWLYNVLDECKGGQMEWTELVKRFVGNQPMCSVLLLEQSRWAFGSLVASVAVLAKNDKDVWSVRPNNQVAQTIVDWEETDLVEDSGESDALDLPEGPSNKGDRLDEQRALYWTREEFELRLIVVMVKNQRFGLEKLIDSYTDRYNEIEWAKLGISTPPRKNQWFHVAEFINSFNYLKTELKKKKGKQKYVVVFKNYNETMNAIRTGQLILPN